MKNFSISQKNLLILLFILSGGVLINMYVAQYFFGLKPCILCLYQRLPFFVICAISLIALIWRSAFKFAFYAALFLLLANAILALYHLGVEQKIFSLTQKCVSEIPDFSSLEEMRKAIVDEPLARCDQVQFYFLGLSLAAWNAIYCTSLGCALLWLKKRIKS